MGGRYIYGIIKTGDSDLDPICGLDTSGPVYTVAYQGLGCLVSDYSGRDFGSMSKEEVIRHLWGHQVVVEHFMKRHTVLPVKFGTVLATGEEVHALLSQGYSQFVDALARIQDKVEVEVAATWDRGEVLREIGDEAEILHLKEQLAGKPAEETLEQRIQVGKRVKELLDGRRDSYQKQMIDFLKDAALDLQPNPLLSDEMVLNVAFLLHHSQQEDFYNRVEELNRVFRDKVSFRLIGPLPPYSFSTLEIVRPCAQSLDEARRLLGLGEAVSEAEVKEAYRRLGARNHPDSNPGDQQAAGRFVKLRQASSLLLAYCRGRGGDRHTKGERYPLSANAVEDTFLLTVKRLALEGGSRLPGG